MSDLKLTHKEWSDKLVDILKKPPVKPCVITVLVVHDKLGNSRYIFEYKGEDGDYLNIQKKTLKGMVNQAIKTIKEIE